LLRDHPQSIHEDLPYSFRSEDLAPVVEENGGLAYSKLLRNT
jgi:hypothetical protein